MFVDAFTDMAASPTSIAVTRQIVFPLVIVVRDHLEDGKKKRGGGSIVQTPYRSDFLELWSASVIL